MRTSAWNLARALSRVLALQQTPDQFTGSERETIISDAVDALSEHNSINRQTKQQIAPTASSLPVWGMGGGWLFQILEGCDNEPSGVIYLRSQTSAHPDTCSNVLLFKMHGDPVSVTQSDDPRVLARALIEHVECLLAERGETRWEVDSVQFRGWQRRRVTYVDAFSDDLPTDLKV